MSRLSGTRRLVLRGLTATLALVVPIFALAGPASAHGQSLPDTNFYRSTVTAIIPAVAGLDVKLTRAGESVVLTNRTGKIVYVLGYLGEEYLRIGPQGVEENTNSMSAYLNGSLVIAGLPQRMASTQDPPSWRHVSNGQQVTWHDHRVHWMAQQRPPIVAADPHTPHKVFDWSLQLRVNGAPVTVRGELNWRGGLLVGSWTMVLIVLFATVFGAVGVAIMLRGDEKFTLRPGGAVRTWARALHPHSLRLHQ